MSASGVEVSDILNSHAMRHVLVPELDDLLDSQLVQYYPFEKTFEEAKNDPWLILHTSGSTGLPKPVTYTHAAVAAIDMQSVAPLLSDAEVKEHGYQRRKWSDVFAGRLTSPFLYFHIIWSIPTMIFTVFWGSTFVFSIRDTQPTTKDVIRAMKICDTAWLSPSMLDDIAKSDEYIKQLSRFKHIVCTGGLSCTSSPFSRTVLTPTRLPLPVHRHQDLPTNPPHQPLRHHRACGHAHNRHHLPA